VQVGDKFKAKSNGEPYEYEIIHIDEEEGWIKINRIGTKGHCYLHKSIHKHYLEKVLNKKKKRNVKKRKRKISTKTRKKL